MVEHSFTHECIFHAQVGAVTVNSEFESAPGLGVAEGRKTARARCLLALAWWSGRRRVDGKLAEVGCHPGSCFLLPVKSSLSRSSIAAFNRIVSFFL